MNKKGLRAFFYLRLPRRRPPATVASAAKRRHGITSVTAVNRKDSSNQLCSRRDCNAGDRRALDRVYQQFGGSAPGLHAQHVAPTMPLAIYPSSAHRARMVCLRKQKATDRIRQWLFPCRHSIWRMPQTSGLNCFSYQLAGGSGGIRTLDEALHPILP